MAPTTSSDRQFDVCRRPANPAKHIKSPSRTSPQKPSTAPESSNSKAKSAVRDTKITDHVDSDASSELSSSSEEPSDDSDDDDEFANSADNEDPIVNLRANQGQKPVMKLDPEEMGGDIRSFLKDFLPKLKAANEELEAQKAAGTLKTAEILDDGDQTGGSDADDEGEQYIELNLGLGVLEAKDPNADTDTDTAGSSNNKSGEKMDAEQGPSSNEDVLRKLMGQDKAQSPVGIEVVNESKGA